MNQDSQRNCSWIGDRLFVGGIWCGKIHRNVPLISGIQAIFIDSNFDWHPIGKPVKGTKAKCEKIALSLPKMTE